MMNGIKEFNFTKELLISYDDKISQFDELVKLSFDVDKPVYDSLKDFNFKKIELVLDSENNSDKQVTAQFTSTNRPYNITLDIVNGYLRELNQYSRISGDSIEQIDKFLEQQIAENPGRFRKHDLTVNKMARLFNEAFAYQALRAYAFIKDNPLFTTWSYTGLQEYNSDLLSTRTDISFRYTPPTLHQLEGASNVISNIFEGFTNHTSYSQSRTINTIRNLVSHVIAGAGSNQDLYQRLYKEGVLRFTYHDVSPITLIGFGMVIRSTLYTEEDVDKSVLLKDSNYITKVYVPISETKTALVSIASMFGNDIDRDNFIAYIKTDAPPIQTPGGLYQFDLNRCKFTKHWFLANGHRSALTVYNKQSLSNFTGVRTRSISPTTRFFAEYVSSVIESIITTNSCDHCGSRVYELNGLNIDHFDLQDIVKERLQDVIIFDPDAYIHRNTRVKLVYNHELGKKICQICAVNYEESMSRYNGYFSKGYFYSEDGITSKDQIECPEHMYLKDYDYSPDSLYRLSSGDVNPNLGVELEVDVLNLNYDDDDDEHYGDADLGVDRAVGMTMSLLTRGKEHAYAMHDGSLRDGFEIATYPADIYKHMDTSHFNYKPAFKNIVKAGYRGHEAGTAGLHIHLDRDFFGDSTSDQLYRASLMAYIMESNWEDFVKFSRRRYHHLDQWASKKDLKYRVDTNSVKTNEQVARDFVNEYDMDKYVAFNINHMHTFELRIFRSTLNYNTYIATLQFVHNLAKLVKEIDLAQAQVITFKDIIKYEEHSELNTYVGQRFGNDYLN